MAGLPDDAGHLGGDAAGQFALSDLVTSPSGAAPEFGVLGPGRSDTRLLSSEAERSTGDARALPPWAGAEVGAAEMAAVSMLAVITAFLLRSWAARPRPRARRR
jgi:hypothetical protein